MKHGVTLQYALEMDGLAEVGTLMRLCNAHDGLDLKLGADSPLSADEGLVVHFLYYMSGALVGYFSIDGFDEMPLEVCGMVHPDYRRRGIARALLAAVIAECRRRGNDRFLLLCEEASPTGRAFVEIVGADYCFSEHRLTLDVAALPPLPPPHRSFELHRISLLEAALYARVLAAAFDEEVDTYDVVTEMDGDFGWYYLAYLDREPIGTIKALRMDYGLLEPDHGPRLRMGIYAFGVLPAYRGRGYGRHMLRGVIGDLLAAGYTLISMEVETDNDKALGLYLSCGFNKTTTYGYYRVMV